MMMIGWQFGAVVASFVAQTRLLYVEPGWLTVCGGYTTSVYVTKLTRSTQPCIPPDSLSRVPALIGPGKGGNVTSSRWQVALCDPALLYLHAMPRFHPQ